jgi:hypothetical protein
VSVEVGEAIDIPWPKDAAAAKLKEIQPKFVLTMPGGASAITALEIVAAKYVKHIGDAQVGEFAGLALFIVFLDSFTVWCPICPYP